MFSFREDALQVGHNFGVIWICPLANLNQLAFEIRCPFGRVIFLISFGILLSVSGSGSEVLSVSTKFIGRATDYAACCRSSSGKPRGMFGVLGGWNKLFS